MVKGAVGGGGSHFRWQQKSVVFCTYSSSMANELVIIVIYFMNTMIKDDIEGLLLYSALYSSLILWVWMNQRPTPVDRSIFWPAGIHRYRSHGKSSCLKNVNYLVIKKPGYCKKHSCLDISSARASKWERNPWNVSGKTRTLHILQYRKVLHMQYLLYVRLWFYM